MYYVVYIIKDICVELFSYVCYAGHDDDPNNDEKVRPSVKPK